MIRIEKGNKVIFKKTEEEKQLSEEIKNYRRKKNQVILSDRLDLIEKRLDAIEKRLGL